MAAEGKAIYVPGKSAKEMPAENALGLGDDDLFMSMTLTETEADMLDASLGDAAMLIRDAANLMSFLSVGLSLGYLDADGQELRTILRLSERAFLAADGKEVRALERLDSIFRRDMAKAIDRKASQRIAA